MIWNVLKAIGLIEKTTIWEKQFEKSYVGGSEKNLILGKYSNSKATDEFSKGSIALSHFLKGFASLTKKKCLNDETTVGFCCCFSLWV